MPKKLTYICLFAALSIATAGTTKAQIENRSANSVGVGGGGAAWASGTEALFVNPARLASGSARSTHFAIGNTSFFTGGPLLQFRAYNNAFTAGEVIDRTAADEIIADWFGASSLKTVERVGIHAETVPLAITMRRNRLAFGLALRTRSYAQAGFNGGWVDLLLVGTAEDRVVPLNSDITVVEMSDISFGIGYVTRDSRLALGWTPRLVLGSNYSRLQLNSSAEVSNQTIQHDFEYTIRSAGSLNSEFVSQVNLFDGSPFGDASLNISPFQSSGIGFGSDVGVTFQYSDRVQIAASITDLGFVTWSKDAATYSPVGDQFLFEGIELDLDELDTQFDNNFGDYIESKLDSLAREAYEETTRVDGSFKTALPAAVHAGASWKLLGGKAKLAAGSSIPLNSSPGNLTPNPTLHVGGEYRLGGRYGVPIRGGAHLGGSGALTMSFGFGVHLGAYQMDLGFAATPLTTFAGQGGRYAVALSLLNVSF